jgi:hypothetical protein
MPSPKLAAAVSLCLITSFAVLAWDAENAAVLASTDVSVLPNHNIEVSEEPPEFGNLFVAPGVENTFYTCIACHSEMIVAQQGLTRDGWVEMLEWMVDEQGMDMIEEPDLSEILDYLATNYNVDRPNFPQPRK